MLKHHANIFFHFDSNRILGSYMKFQTESNSSRRSQKSPLASTRARLCFATREWPQHWCTKNSKEQSSVKRCSSCGQW